MGQTNKASPRDTRSAESDTGSVENDWGKISLGLEQKQMDRLVGAFHVN